jgi:hypothetical protein
VAFEDLGDGVSFTPDEDDVTLELGPGSAEVPVNEQHPGVTALTRAKLMNFAATPATAKRFLEKEGFEVVDRGNFNFSIRKPGEAEFKVVDPEGLDLQDVTDVAGDVFEGVTSVVGAGFGTTAGALGGPAGALAGGVAGGAAGAAAGEGVKQGIGSLLGIEATPEESIERLKTEAIAGAGGEILGRAAGLVSKGVGKAAGGVKSLAGKAVDKAAKRTLPGQAERQGARELGRNVVDDLVPDEVADKAVREVTKQAEVGVAGKSVTIGGSTQARATTFKFLGQEAKRLRAALDDVVVSPNTKARTLQLAKSVEEIAARPLQATVKDVERSVTRLSRQFERLAEAQEGVAGSQTALAQGVKKIGPGILRGLTDTFIFKTSGAVLRPLGLTPFFRDASGRVLRTTLRRTSQPAVKASLQTVVDAVDRGPAAYRAALFQALHAPGVREFLQGQRDVSPEPLEP